MASIKLGAIITDMAGSIGGTTVRRTQRGLIMYNKQGRQIKSAYSANNKRLQLGSIFSSWRLLDETIKNEWENLAALFRFTNKFGEEVILTGRELYTKCNGTLVPIGWTPNLYFASDPIPENIVSAIYLNSTLGECNIDYNNTGYKVLLFVEVYLLREGQKSNPTKNYFTTFAKDVTGQTNSGIYEYIYSQFPFIQPEQYFGFNIYFVNFFGLRSAVQSFVVKNQS